MPYARWLTHSRARERLAPELLNPHEGLCRTGRCQPVSQRGWVPREQEGPHCTPRTRAPPRPVPSSRRSSSMAPSPPFPSWQTVVLLYPCMLPRPLLHRAEDFRGHLSARLPCKTYEARARGTGMGPGTQVPGLALMPRGMAQADGEAAQHSREGLWTQSRAGGVGPPGL